MKRHYPSGAENCWKMSVRVEKVTRQRLPRRTSFVEGGGISGGVGIKIAGGVQRKGFWCSGVLPKYVNNLWLIALIVPETGRTWKEPRSNYGSWFRGFRYELCTWVRNSTGLKRTDETEELLLEVKYSPVAAGLFALMWIVWRVLLGFL